MTTDPTDVPNNPPGENPEGPVPRVDPADLRRVWEMRRDVQSRVANAGGRGAAISHEWYQRACSPGANVGAVWCRLSMVNLLNMLGMLAPWIHDGVRTNVVFKVAATFPMNGVPVGVPRQGLPCDVQEFVAQVSKDH